MTILKQYSRYEIPEIVNTTIKEQMRRYGLLKLVPEDNDIILIFSDAILLNEICKYEKNSAIY